MKKNCTNIGGQAVLEGVMMRGESSMATACRAPSGEIEVDSYRFKSAKEKSWVHRAPIIRGVISFFSSLVMGIKLTNRSAEVYAGEEEEPSRFEKWLAKTFNVDIMKVITAIGVVLGILLSIGLFVFVPQLAATGIFSLAKIDASNFGWGVLYNFIAGFIRMAIFIIYLVLISLMKDIKRLFGYHGAEHKTISAYENGLELTVENVQKMTTRHDRCGTTFMFIVMAFSILFFSIFPVELLANAGTVVNFILRVLSRIVMIPLVAGISYELLKLFARYDNWFTRICKQPGLWLQKLTTRQPDDEMVEVAIVAFREVLALEADKEYPLKSFDVDMPVKEAVEKLTEKLGEKAEAELIVMHVTGAKTRTELYEMPDLDVEKQKSCKKFADRRVGGAPLQYVLGETCFYGLDIKTDARALIPRFDTEVVVEAAIKEAKRYTKPSVLDLCTGSGAIALAIKQNVDSTVVGTDISRDALELAETNSLALGLDVEWKCGSLFRAVKNRRFDLIVANPPYIKSGAIADLDKEVREYEPRLALDGGADGLDFYRDIVAAAPAYLNKGGCLVLEVGQGQAELVIDLLQDKFDVLTACDMNDPPIERAVIAVLKDEYYVPPTEKK